MVEGSFKINRTPVLTLWANIVAERPGFGHDEALTLGQAVAGLNAYSKGKRLGIFKPSHDELLKRRSAAPTVSLDVELKHRAVPVVGTPEGIRALSKGKPTSPKNVEKYLESKFGEHLSATERVMADLAMSFPPSRLHQIPFRLYEEFRPEVPARVEGWGAASTLDLARIRATGTTTGVR
jgi:hypothetical protein